MQATIKSSGLYVVPSEPEEPTYLERVLDTSNLLAVWALDETSGSVANDSSPNGYDVAYTSGVTLAQDAPPMGGLAPVWDGVNDYASLYNASLAGAIDFDEITATIWVKMQNAGVWTDSTARQIFRFRDSGGIDEFRCRKTTANNTLEFTRIGNSASKTVTVGGISDTGWFCIQMTATVAGDEFEVFKDQVQIGTTQTGLTAAAGSGMDSLRNALGNAVNFTVSSPFSGYLAYLILHNKYMDAEIAALGAV